MRVPVGHVMVPEKGPCCRIIASGTGCPLTVEKISLASSKSYKTRRLAANMARTATSALRSPKVRSRWGLIQSKQAAEPSSRTYVHIGSKMGKMKQHPVHARYSAKPLHSVRSQSTADLCSAASAPGVKWATVQRSLPTGNEAPSPTSW